MTADEADAAELAAMQPGRALLTVFDLETTGVDIETCRILTAFVGTIDALGRTVTRHSWTVNPGIPIPPEATKVNGITDDFVELNGMDAADAIADIAVELTRHKLPVVAFNAAYDLSTLDREMRRHKFNPHALEALTVVDPYVLDKALDQFRPGKRTLDVMCAHYGITLNDAHTAEADAVAAGRLAMIQKHDHRLIEATWSDIHSWSIVWRRRQQDSLADYFRSVGKDVSDVRNEWPIIPFGGA